jgi:hypothetical protein
MPTAPRRYGFYFRYTLFCVLLLLLLLEIGLRILGFRPWEPSSQAFSVTPGGRMFQADSLLGFKGRPGAYRARIADQLDFDFTHDSSGFRILPSASDDSLAPEVWLFGCSFTHGFGVDDSATWAWRLARHFPGHRFRNFGMTAYGTLQSQLLLNRLLRTPIRRPRLVVLAYGDFHEQRNTANRFWRKALAGRAAADSLRYPHAIYRDSSHYDIAYTRLAYQPWPGQRHSALIHWLENLSNAREDVALHSHALTQTLIREMAQASTSAQARFLLTGIWAHPGTTQLLTEMAAEGIATSDWSVDLSDSSLRLLPDDGHPNARTHALIAAKAIASLTPMLDGDKR